MHWSMLFNRRPALSSPPFYLYFPIYLSFCLCLFRGSAFGAVSFPKPAGWVTDQAGLLDASTRDHLERLLTEVERKSGVEIAVVTLSTLGSRSVEEVAVELFQAWGIGKKGRDEGLLLLVAQKERKIRIEVGYGLEGTIPDGLAGEIIRETIAPRFRQGRFAEGVEAGVQQIVETIAREKQLDITTSQSPRARPTASGLRIEQRRLVSRATLFFLLLLVGLIVIGLAQERSLRNSRGTQRARRRFLLYPYPPAYYGGGWSGGGFGSSDSGGYGGFGGGASGGGGAGGSW